MTSKKHQNIEGQEPLFEGARDAEYTDSSITTWRQLENVESPESPEAPVTQPENVGIYVDLTERAQHLDAALAAIGQRNSREGFDIAARVRPHSGGIWARYQDATPIVVEGAERNAGEYSEVIKKEFWAATGYSALRGSGLMRSDLIERYGRKDWGDFVDKFDHPNNRPTRDRFRRHLKRVIRTSSTSKAA